MRSRAEAAFAQHVDQLGTWEYEPECFADQNGRIFVRVGNRSPVTLNNIRVDVAAVIGGNIQRRSVQTSNLRSGTQTDIASGLAFPRDSTWTPDMMNAVVAAANP
jgi:DNA gyrase inhibitor GyrI